METKFGDIVELPRRKNIRLKEYDYSSNGAYFLTICVKEKSELLGAINVGANCVRPVLSDIGQTVEGEIATLSKTYEGIVVDKFIIMPNHIHMIIIIDYEQERTQFAPTISRIVKQFKGAITKQIGYSIWQRSYNDHIIRNKEDYLRIWQYIEENPAKWTDDEYYVHT